MPRYVPHIPFAECTFTVLACMLSLFSCVWLLLTLRMVDRQDPLFTGFSRQEYWSGLPCPPPEDLPNPGTESASLMSPTLAGGFFTTSATTEIIFESRLLCQGTKHETLFLYLVIKLLGSTQECLPSPIDSPQTLHPAPSVFLITLSLLIDFVSVQFN